MSLQGEVTTFAFDHTFFSLTHARKLCLKRGLKRNMIVDILYNNKTINVSVKRAQEFTAAQLIHKCK